jgi:predicted alpha-1,2-mannosidase
MAVSLDYLPIYFPSNLCEGRWQMTTANPPIPRTIRAILLGTLAFPSFVQALFAAPVSPTEPVFLANPLQGTDSSPSFSHGNTYPAIALPFPMHTWAPYTQPRKDSFYYQHRSREIRGIRQTHQPSAWIPEYGAFALMPVTGRLAISEDERVSTFDHANETAQPSYYSVRLDTWKTTAEVTPTERAARFRFTFPRGTDAFVILDLFPSEKFSSVEVFPAEHAVVGTARNNRGAVPDNFGNHLVAIFDQPFTTGGVWLEDKPHPGATRIEGNHVGAFLKFDTSASPEVGCRIASSFISGEQARRTLDREIGNADFDTVRGRAESAWNDTLNRVRVEGGTEEQRRTFYSALYRSVLFPHRFFEHGADGRPVYFSPYDGRVHPGFCYTDTGYWDTFRAAHPLYNLLFPEVSTEIVQAVMNAYSESGWLPQWSSPGHRGAMIGNHAFSVLADAWVKGVRSFDLNAAVDAVTHDAHNEGLFGVGRGGWKLYDQLGYVSHPEVPDATAKTLEYAYDDFCAAVLARAAGRAEVAEAFTSASMNYANVFDASTGFMRGRKKDGAWSEPFDPVEWGGPFTEGNAWQWTWSVMHDVPGLIRLLGSEEAFVAKLDGLFNAGSEVRVGTYRHMIHEMNEMVAQNLGQYAHCNEPNHHVAYLYNYAGQPWKTQVRVRQIMNLLYQSTPDGLAGDEDNGQMSAWFVLSALGVYPVCPGTDVYAIGSPLFDSATVTVPGRQPLTVTARNNGPQRPYIESATLNGARIMRPFLTHGQLMAGGELTFDMASGPVKDAFKD